MPNTANRAIFAAQRPKPFMVLEHFQAKRIAVAATKARPKMLRNGKRAARPIGRANLSIETVRTWPFWSLIRGRRRESRTIIEETLAAAPPAEELAASALAPDLIDVKKLIGEYDVCEHARRSDEYYRNFSLSDSQFRKPFMGAETIELISKLGVVLSNLDFFPGARVVDFGSGPGWLAQSLALMGCRVVAADVSRRALKLGKAYTAAKYPELVDQITYLPFDGFALDLPSGSADRIVCFIPFTTFRTKIGFSQNSIAC